MTVAELIEELRKQPQDVEVCIPDDYNADWETVTEVDYRQEYGQVHLA